jgi:hypothetical protein
VVPLNAAGFLVAAPEEGIDGFQGLNGEEPWLVDVAVDPMDALLSVAVADVVVGEPGFLSPNGEAAVVGDFSGGVEPPKGGIDAADPLCALPKGDTALIWLKPNGDVALGLLVESLEKGVEGEVKVPCLS